MFDGPPAEFRDPPPAFERVVLDERVGVGYGVAIADVDGDGRRDVLVVDQHEVRWHRAPDWERRTLCGRLTELDHVCIAARDVAGDAKAEIAIGAGWNPGDTATNAPCFVLEPGADPLAARTPIRIDVDPTLHRMKWVLDRRSEARLVALPLHGRGNANAEGEGVRLVELRRASAETPWTAESVPTPLHQTHNFDVVEWDGDADEELVVAGREGLFLFDREDGAGAWRTTELVGAATGHAAFPGASEVRLGRFANGRRFLAAVEPFHGNALVAYLEPRRPGEPWARRLLDDGMNEAHALVCRDFLSRGDDQIVVGWRRVGKPRDPGSEGKTGLRFWAPRIEDEDGGLHSGFERFELDDRIACEDLALGDLDEDGRLDLVASGRDSHDLVLFLNRCEQGRPRDGTSPKLERAPFDVAHLDSIDGVIADAIAAKKMPGCVVAIGRSDGLLFVRAYGQRALLPEPVPMTADVLFDVASLTKPIATATSIALLVEEGRLRLDEPLSRHLSELAARAVTVRQCLEHTAGFVPDNELADYEHGVDHAWRRLFAQVPASEPGAKFVYSDVGYELLGLAVERVSGTGLGDFARERIFEPLGMAETGFLPRDEWKTRAVPTEPRDGAMLQGVVHDPRAALLGGVAGHAGLFSTARDLARYARMLLNQGELDGVRVLTPASVAALTNADVLPGGVRRTPGFDARSRLSSNRGELMTSRAFGHGGFTGTGMWIDPGLDLFVIFLSSRLHPDGKGNVNALIGRIGTIAAAAVGRPAVARRVRTGLEVLLDSDTNSVSGSAAIERYAGKKIGLIANASSRRIDGVPSWQALAKRGLEVAAIFTPEHGLDARRDETIPDGGAVVDGIPVRSLYGAERKPTKAMLAGIDVLMFDVQDAGARCYTYLSTLGLCMEAAAENGLGFVVLDRPNPIGGAQIEGPLPDPGRESFTNHHSVPFRHGMTVGELARLFRAERLPSIALDVVAMEGWRRGDAFDDTLLPWTNPSPNLRTLDGAFLYPGLVLFEPTNLSVGRGTDLPFEQIGAPWLDAAALVLDLATRPLPGANVMAVEFTPQSSKFAGGRCRGLRFNVVDRGALVPMRVALEIAAALQARHPREWNLDAMDALLCSKRTIEALRAGESTDQIWERWQRDAVTFRERRRPFLLYD